MIKMKLVTYGKYRMKKDIEEALLAAPKQAPNTEEAFAGKVFELCQKEGGPVGTLSEIYEYCRESEVVIEVMDGFLIVKRDQEGHWREWEVREILGIP